MPEIDRTVLAFPEVDDVRFDRSVAGVVRVTQYLCSVRVVATLLLPCISVIV